MMGGMRYPDAVHYTKSNKSASVPVRASIDSHSSSTSSDSVSQCVTRSIQLTKAQEGSYEHMAKSMLSKVLRSMEKGGMRGDKPWQDLGTTEDFSKLMRVKKCRDNPNANKYKYRLQGKIRCRFEKVLRRMVTKTDRRSVMSRRNIWYSDALDAKTLAVLQGPTEQDPLQFLGVRWEAFDLSSFHAPVKSDHCVLEYSGTGLDPTGTPVGYLVINSVVLPECPDQAGFMRSHSKEVAVFRPSADGIFTEFVVQGTEDPALRSNSSSLNERMAILATNLTQLPIRIQSQKLSSLKLKKDCDLVPKNQRKNCGFCHKKFGMLSTKHNCRLCGEVICSNCIVERPIHQNKAPIKFCKQCIIQMTRTTKNKTRKADGRSQSHDSTTLEDMVAPYPPRQQPSTNSRSRYNSQDIDTLSCSSGSSGGTVLQHSMPSLSSYSDAMSSSSSFCGEPVMPSSSFFGTTNEPCTPQSDMIFIHDGLKQAPIKTNKVISTSRHGQRAGNHQVNNMVMLNEGIQKCSVSDPNAIKEEEDDCMILLDTRDMCKVNTVTHDSQADDQPVVSGMEESIAQQKELLKNISQAIRH